MKAVYSNTACPKLVKWMAIVAALVGVACFGLYLSQVFNGEGVRLFLYISAFLLIYGAMFYGEYLLLTITVDKEKDARCWAKARSMGWWKDMAYYWYNTLLWSDGIGHRLLMAYKVMKGVGVNTHKV